MIQRVKKTVGVVLLFAAVLLLLSGCVGHSYGTSVSTGKSIKDNTSTKATTVVTGKYIKWESEGSVVTNLTNSPVVVQGHSSDSAGEDVLSWSIGLPPNGKRAIDSTSGPRLVVASQSGIILEVIDIK